jgi:Ni/Co efflux regulator RcnB
MFRNGLAATGFLAILISGALASAPAFAKKPPEAGGGKGAEHAQKGKGNSKKQFNKNDRDIVHEYFAREFRGGHCPPGLAKKRNGCLPPGQAKKWRIGQSLPRDVMVYDLPSKLVVKISLPPPGYKYVRVASDILLIAIGTSMVVDAITDLGRL